MRKCDFGNNAKKIYSLKKKWKNRQLINSLIHAEKLEATDLNEKVKKHKKCEDFAAMIR